VQLLASQLALHDAIMKHNDDVRSVHAARGTEGIVLRFNGFTSTIGGASDSASTSSKAQKRRLSHARYVQPSPQFGRPAMLLALFAGILFTAGSIMSCYYSSHGQMEEAYHKQQKPHRMAYVGCPYCTCVGTGIYVLFVLIAIIGAIAGSIPSDAGLPAPAPSPPAATPAAATIIQQTCPKAPGAASSVTMPNAPDGSCCTVGQHPAWVQAIGGLAYNTNPFSPLTCKADFTGYLDSCTVQGGPCRTTPPPAGIGTLLSADAFKQWLLGMVGFGIKFMVPEGGISQPMAQSLTAVEVDPVALLGTSKFGPITMSNWKVYGALPFPSQLHQFYFPMKAKIESINRFGFDAGIGTGPAGGLDFGMSQTMTANMGDIGMTMSGTMTASSVSLSLGLTIDSPTFVERDGGHGIAFHEVVFRIMVSVPTLKVGVFNLDVKLPSWCQKKCNWAYAPHICICKEAFSAAEKIAKPTVKGVFNSVFANGLNQFTPGKNAFLDLNIDVGPAVNELLKGTALNHPMINGVCSIFNGCGGKTLDAMVSSGVIWSQVMVSMFVFFFTSCCCSCYCRAKYKASKPQLPKSLRKGHAKLEKSCDLVTVSLPYSERESAQGLGALKYIDGAVLVPPLPKKKKNEPSESDTPPASCSLGTQSSQSTVSSSHRLSFTSWIFYQPASPTPTNHADLLDPTSYRQTRDVGRFCEEVARGIAQWRASGARDLAQKGYGNRPWRHRDGFSSCSGRSVSPSGCGRSCRV
jgi:hypothetical protein